jgi:hypothetical protein
MRQPDEKRPTAAEYLQRPSRLKCLDGTEEHLTTAHNLARALWLLLSVEEDGPDTSDPRDLAALQELACAVADHAGAARVAYYKESDKRRRERDAPA